MSTQFTPGPWTVHPTMAWVSPLADLDLPICQMRVATDKVSCEPQALADARLIATAPLLYDKLTHLPALPSSFDQWDRFRSYYESYRRECQELLALASGVSHD